MLLGKELTNSVWDKASLPTQASMMIPAQLLGY